MRGNVRNDSRIDYSTFSSFNNDQSDSVVFEDGSNKAPYIRNN